MDKMFIIDNQLAVPAKNVLEFTANSNGTCYVWYKSLDGSIKNTVSSKSFIFTIENFNKLVAN